MGESAVNTSISRKTYSKITEKHKERCPVMIYWANIIFKLCIRLIPLYIVAETMMYGGFFMFNLEIVKEFLFDCRMR